jgi:hypothetical protein
MWSVLIFSHVSFSIIVTPLEILLSYTIYSEKLINSLIVSKTILKYLAKSAKILFSANELILCCGDITCNSKVQLFISNPTIQTWLPIHYHKKKGYYSTFFFLPSLNIHMLQLLWYCSVWMLTEGYNVIFECDNMDSCMVYFILSQLRVVVLIMGL